MNFSHPIASRLPDEMIKEILQPVLHISEQTFVTVPLSSSASPFATYQPSNSAILLVCKTWLRVATPLLYTTVIIRSRAQAQALACTLKLAPDLGRYIKMIRIEGGYGSPISRILKASPQITHLWHSAALWSNESIAGYKDALPLINPQCLIVADDDRQDSVICKGLYEVLGEAAQKSWTNLCTVVFDLRFEHSERAQPLVTGLCKGQASIKRLGFHYTEPIHPVFIDLFSLSSIEQIHLQASIKKSPFESSRPDSRCALQRKVFRDMALSEKVTRVRKFFSSDSKSPLAVPVPVDSVRPSPIREGWQPFMGVSDNTKGRILASIIQEAAMPYLLGTAEIANKDGPISCQSFRSALTRVSKDFRKPATLYLYTAPIVDSGSITPLSASPFISLIRYLWLCGAGWTSAAGPIESLHQVINSCKNLTLLSEARDSKLQQRPPYPRDFVEPFPYSSTDWASSIFIPTRSLTALARGSATTLQHLHVSVRVEKKRNAEAELVTIFSSLAVLRELRSLVLIAGDGTTKSGEAEHSAIPHLAFPFLERLTVHLNSVLNETFVCALCPVKLPSLEWLRIDCNSVERLKVASCFLRTHGRKLVYLRTDHRFLALFPYFHRLVKWDCDIFHNQCNGLPDLKRLADVNVRADFKYTLKVIAISIGDFRPKDVEVLVHQDLSHLKTLSVIQVRGLRWSVTQREIEKCPWVIVSEALTEKHGILIADSYGTEWIPRLKTRSNRL